MKEYADARLYAIQIEFSIGDTVLLRTDKKSNKLKTPWNPATHEIANKRGRMVAVKIGDKKCFILEKNSNRFPWHKGNCCGGSM